MMDDTEMWQRLREILSPQAKVQVWGGTELAAVNVPKPPSYPPLEQEWRELKAGATTGAELRIRIRDEPMTDVKATRIIEVMREAGCQPEGEVIRTYLPSGAGTGQQIEEAEGALHFVCPAA